MLTVAPDIFNSTVPVYLHRRTGLPYQSAYSDLDTEFLLAGYQGTTCISALFLRRDHGIVLDVGTRIEYTEYRSEGIRAFYGLGFDTASSCVLYVAPTLSQVGPILADLVTSTRPSSLCKKKLKRDHGNVYVPDYLSLLSGDADGRIVAGVPTRS
jgi:hypothetical protein